MQTNKMENTTGIKHIKGPVMAGPTIAGYRSEVIRASEWARGGPATDIIAALLAAGQWFRVQPIAGGPDQLSSHSNGMGEDVLIVAAEGVFDELQIIDPAGGGILPYPLDHAQQFGITAPADGEENTSEMLSRMAGWSAKATGEEIKAGNESNTQKGEKT